MSAISKRLFIISDIGLEIQCSKCKDMWPATTEFFFKTKKGGVFGFMHWCRACFKEYRQTKMYSKDKGRRR